MIHSDIANRTPSIAIVANSAGVYTLYPIASTNIGNGIYLSESKDYVIINGLMSYKKIAVQMITGYALPTVEVL